MADYFMLFSPGLVGATIGSLANSLYKKHDNKKMFMRVAESALVGFPAHYLLVNYLPITAGTPTHVAAVGGIVYLFWNNKMTSNLVVEADGYGTSVFSKIWM